jgi:glutathione S-transferase
MPIELYVFPPSPRAFKVMSVANHLGIDFTLRFLNILAGEHRQPDYAALNPNMRMPTMIDGDFTLWESNAMSQYLASKRPEGGLFPADPRGAADVARWQFWESQHWDPACVTYLFQNVVKPLAGLGEPDAAALAAAEAPFHRAAKVLDDHLKDKSYVAGGKLSLADFTLGAPLIHAAGAKYPLDGYGEIKRWYEGLAALPAWQKTLQQQQSAMAKVA